MYTYSKLKHAFLNILKNSVRDFLKRRYFFKEMFKMIIEIKVLNQLKIYVLKNIEGKQVCTYYDHMYLIIHVLQFMYW